LRLKRWIPGPIVPVIRPVYHAVYRSWVPWLLRYADLRDRPEVQRSGFPRLPPAKLRFRVGETPWVSTFLEVGEKCSQSIQACLEAAGRPFASLGSVLDFGCGCGRVLIWLHRSSPQTHFHGTDTDQDAIRWCRENLPFASFGVNRPAPPLEFRDGSFDLIYAVSVFTHLDEELQRRWLEELRRVLKPKGLLLFTVHGRAAWSGLEPDAQRLMEERGFLCTKSSKLRGHLPQWYGTAYHSPEYVRETLGSLVRIIAYIPEGLGYQDVVIAGR
jgi:SAM-dependent methyltransferase